MINKLIKWLEDNNRLPSMDNLAIVDTLSQEELISKQANTLWLYKPFLVKEEYQKEMITDCIKNEINMYFLDTINFDNEKIQLENWVLENMELVKNTLEKELRKRIATYKGF